MKMNMKRRTNGNARADGAKRYTCCVAQYYVPGLDKSEIVLVTIAILDLRSDLLVTHHEYWGEFDDLRVAVDLEVAVNEARTIAQRYGAPIYVVSEPVPLEKCHRGCDVYEVRVVSRRELAAIQHDLLNHVQPRARIIEAQAGERGEQAAGLNKKNGEPDADGSSDGGPDRP